MRFGLSNKFRKNFQKRVPANSSLANRYVERVEIFSKDPRSPVIKDHALAGKLLGFRAFWITGDVRVVYFQETENSITFVDIGTHNQVYGK